MEEHSLPRRPSARSRIYRHLHEATGFCSRQSLADDLGLSLPTVYQNLTELMEDGLVCESGEQQSTGGRKAMGLGIVPEARFAVGVSVSEKWLRIAAADLNLRELCYRKVPFAAIRKDTAEVSSFAAELERFLDETGLDRARLLGVGVTLPGVLSPDGSRILLAPTLGLRDVPLEALTRDLPYPTHVENDATSGGHAEWHARGGQRNMAYLSLETGVGGAVLIGGVPYGGDNGRSGEFGHMCVEPGGLRCSCGKQGCLEAYCSARRISDDLGIPLEDFFAGLERHNPEYEALWSDLLRHLALGVGSIHRVLDCDVVLGGSLTRWLPPYLPLLRRYVSDGNPFTHDADFLHLSVLHDHTAPLGAALYFVRQFVASV